MDGIVVNEDARLTCSFHRPSLVRRVAHIGFSLNGESDKIALCDVEMSSSSLQLGATFRVLSLAVEALSGVAT